MHTRPAAFAAAHLAVNCERHIIVKLYDGTDTFYFSDTEMHLSDGHVYGILDIENFGGIHESVDIVSKDWAVDEAEVYIKNRHYRIDTSGNHIKPSDDLGDMANGTVDIYLCAGSNVAALSDCLHRFAGTVLDGPEYDDYYVTIRALDNTFANSITLPQRIVDDEYDDPPEETKTEKIPIVYGQFYQRSAETASIFSGPGLARAIRATRGILPSEFVISDHACDAYENLYFKVGGGNAAFQVGGITSVTTGPGSGTIQALRETTNYCLQYFGLGDDIIDDYDDSIYEATDPSYISDGNQATRSKIYDNIHDASTVDASGQGGWKILEQEVLRQALVLISGDLLDPDNPPKLYVRQKYIEFVDFTNTSGNYIQYVLYYSRDSGTDRKYTLKELSGPIAGADYQQSGWVAYECIAASSLPYIIDTPLMFVIYGYVLGGDGVTENDIICQQGEADIGIKITLIEPPMIAWAAVDGREFGSWIDDVSRSNGKNAGDLIEDPAWIIESILRDELGYGDSDIDMGSFDGASGGSTMRFNLHSENEMNSNDAIKYVAEHGKFAFFWSAVAKARLIDLDDGSPTTAARGSHPIHIPYSHIKDGYIKVWKTRDDYDMVEYKCNYQQENKRFAVEGSYSSGDRVLRVEWPGFTNAVASNFSSHVLSIGNVHNRIRLRTLGFIYADLEVGDWIEIDDTTVDPHIKCFGSSWSGKQFLITGIHQGFDGTEINAIELN